MKVTARIKWCVFRIEYNVEHLLKSMLRKIFRVQFKIRKVGKNILMESAEFQSWCINKIDGGEPFMVTRFGSVEASFFFYCLGIENGAIKDMPPKYKMRMCENAGFFPPPDEALCNKYAELIKKIVKSIDVLCYWETGFQRYLVKNCFDNDILLTELDNLQPWFNEGSRIWTEALKGKKVLVIHPFTETIKKQYANREKIWEDQRVLPEFELYTLKAVQTIAGTKDERFETWFDALDYMYNEAMKIPFDIAIIACGAYGMPLAALLKESGKQAIHWGGMSQIWMGIKGARWDNNLRVNCFYNDAWVRPSQEEMPKGKGNVESGCYW